jgi:predicted metal-binding transcription factor (methanogenesis marker protein 9)
MQSVFFWREWKLSTRLIYLFLLLFFFANIIFLGFTYFMGLDNVIPYLINEQTNVLKTNLGEVVLGMFHIPLEGELFTQQTNYSPQLLTLQKEPYIFYGTLLAIVITGLLAVVSKMKFIPYMLGMVVFIFWLSRSNLDILEVLPNNLLLIITFIIFGGVSYYFQAFGTNANLGIRFLVFGILVASWLFFVLTKSPIKYPSLFLVAHLIWLPIILTCFFVFITAIEILRGIFYLLVKHNAQAGGQNLRHFTILSIIYWLNLLLYYFDYTNYWKIDIFLVDILIFFVLSSILGVWGFKQRESIYVDFFDFNCTGAFLYILLGILAFSTFNFNAYIGNISYLVSMKYFILYAYLGFGLMFYGYLMLNFMPLVKDSQPIQKIMFDGISFDFAWARYFTLAIIIGLATASKYKPYYQMSSSAKTLKGDAYYFHQDFRNAGIFYEYAFYDDFVNPRCNYALSSLAAKKDNFSEQMQYLKPATYRTATEQVYLRWARLLVDDEREKDAITLLRAGIEKMPTSAKIANNLGLLYGKTGNNDSTFYFLQYAQKYAHDQIPNANLLAYLANNTKTSEATKKSVIQLDLGKNDLKSQLNLLALYIQNKLEFKQFNDNLWQKEINTNGFAYVYNYALNRLGKDTSALKHIKKYDQKDVSGQFGSRLQFAYSFTNYYAGQADKGIQGIVGMSELNSEPYFNTIVGLWLAEQGDFVAAESYFDKASMLGSGYALMYQAICWSELGKIEKALPLWEKALQNNEISNESKKQIAKVFNVLGDSAKIEDDIDRYNFLHYHSKRLPQKIKEKIFEEMKDTHYKLKIATEETNYALDLQEYEKASFYFETLKTLKSHHKITNSAAQYAYLRYLLTKNAAPRVLEEMQKMEWIGLYQYKKDFLKGVALQNIGNTKEAEKYFNTANLVSPYSIEVILNSAEFYKNIKKDNQKAYLILVEAIRGRNFSLPLYKMYALQCVEMRLENYAEDALNEIQKNAPNEFPAIEKIVRKRMEELKIENN